MDNSEYGRMSAGVLTLCLLLQCSKLQGGRVGEVGVARLVVLMPQALVQLREVWMLPLTRGCQSAGHKKGRNSSRGREQGGVCVCLYHDCKIGPIRLL